MFFAADERSATAASSIVTEALASIRTVAAFGLQDRILALFKSSLTGQYRAAVRAHWIAGLSFGFSQFATFITFAVCFYGGARLIDQGRLSFGDMLNVFFVMSFSGFAIGETMSMADDQVCRRCRGVLHGSRCLCTCACTWNSTCCCGCGCGCGCLLGVPTAAFAVHVQAKAAAAKDKVFALLDTKSTIDPLARSGIVPSEPFRGKIEFRNVVFSYPQRPGVRALDDVSFVVPAGAFAAFVGGSGSGKSTIVRLLLRFYSPTSGEILVDDRPVADLDVAWLRSQFGLVSQEPELFSGACVSMLCCPCVCVGGGGLGKRETVCRMKPRLYQHVSVAGSWLWWQAPSLLTFSTDVSATLS